MCVYVVVLAKKKAEVMNTKQQRAHIFLEKKHTVVYCMCHAGHAKVMHACKILSEKNKTHFELTAEEQIDFSLLCVQHILLTFNIKQIL